MGALYFPKGGFSQKRTINVSLKKRLDRLNLLILNERRPAPAGVEARENETTYIR